MAQTAIIDGNGQLQTRVMPGVEVMVDRSGAIQATGASQQLMAANVLRGGWFFQNLDPANSMSVNELGEDATVLNSFTVPPLGTFPPLNFPLTVGQINVAGTLNGAYAAREW